MTRKQYLRKLRIQKILGAGLLIISIIIPVINNGDATASVLTAPLGFYALCTKEIIIY